MGSPPSAGIGLCWYRPRWRQWREACCGGDKNAVVNDVETRSNDDVQAGVTPGSVASLCHASYVFLLLCQPSLAAADGRNGPATFLAQKSALTAGRKGVRAELMTTHSSIRHPLRNRFSHLQDSPLLPRPPPSAPDTRRALNNPSALSPEECPFVPQVGNRMSLSMSLASYKIGPTCSSSGRYYVEMVSDPSVLVS